MFSQQMLATVVGWDLYLSTRSPVVLGNVGLVQIIPVLLFTFVAGHVADRYNRSRTAMVTQVAQALVAFALAAAGSGRGVVLIYACLFLTATARAFQWPATSALLPQTVPPENLTQAISWSGSAREMANMGGPALAGGLIAGFGSEAVYTLQAVFCVLAAVCFGLMRVPDRAEHERPEIGLKAVAEGVRFVWREKLILSAMSLDLLAVFFGGAVALLPIYAEDILKTGATGLGWLRAAPAIGAGLTAVWIAHRPAVPECWGSSAGFRGGVRRGHHRIRGFHLGMAFVWHAVPDRSIRQRQRGAADFAGAIAHAGCAARARIGRERTVHLGLESMGRGGIGRGRGLDGHGPVGGIRRSRNDRGGGRGGERCRPACGAGRTDGRWRARAV